MKCDWDISFVSLMKTNAIHCETGNYAQNDSLLQQLWRPPRKNKSEKQVYSRPAWNRLIFAKLCMQNTHETYSRYTSYTFGVLGKPTPAPRFSRQTHPKLPTDRHIHMLRQLRPKSAGRPFRPLLRLHIRHRLRHSRNKLRCKVTKSFIFHITHSHARPSV